MKRAIKNTTCNRMVIPLILEGEGGENQKKGPLLDYNYFPRGTSDSFKLLPHQLHMICYVEQGHWQLAISVKWFHWCGHRKL